METIIAALITGIVTILGSFLFYNYSISKIGDTTGRIETSVSSNRKDLSTEHKDLSTEHKDLSAEHKALAADHHKIIDGQNVLRHIGSSLREEQIEEKRKLEKLHEFMLEKETAQEQRYHLLSSDHQRMVGQVQQGVNAFTVLIDQVGRLNQRCQQLERQTQQVEQRAQQVERERDELKQQAEHQQAAYNKLTQQYNQLVELFRGNEPEIDR